MKQPNISGAAHHTALHITSRAVQVEGGRAGRGKMKKSLEKMRVRIDQNLNRSEKSVALPPELERIGAACCNVYCTVLY